MMGADDHDAATRNRTAVERGILRNGSLPPLTHDIECHALGCREDIQKGSHGSGAQTLSFLKQFDRTIIMCWIVVEQCKPWDTRCCRHVRRVIGRAVPPPYFRVVLVAGVLGIVDHEVRAPDKFNVPLVAWMMEDRPRRIPEWFVIRHIGDGGPVTADPVCDCRRGVIEILRLDVDVADSEKPFFKLSVVETAR